MRHSINAHVEPRLIFNGKNTHKIKTTKQTQEKKSPHTKKWRENGEISKKSSKNERKTEAKRTKHRLRTNKNADSERTKTPTQNPERTQNPEQSQTPEQKKRCVKTPQKIYASFCEMKPIVLKKPPPSFCGL